MSFAEAAKGFKIMKLYVCCPCPAWICSRQKIFARISEHSLAVKTIPPVASLIDGSANIAEFKDVAIEDLLGREIVAAHPIC